jgi:2-polyprenyl-3-methyl-5-hydroxy-6-metoxy-1,4-benzoquinol methylase
MLEKIKDYYSESYYENERLHKDNAHLVEYLTTIRYFDRLIPPNSDILDACAGTGVYSFYLAEQGHCVTACDLSEHHVEIIKSKPNADKLVHISPCNVLDMPQFADNTFDVVLCMGALYHLPTDELRKQAVMECKRVCKPNGLIVLAYITKYAPFFCDTRKGMEFIGEYIEILNNPQNHIFTFMTPNEINQLTLEFGLEEAAHIGTDGMTYIIADEVNNATDDDFNKYMELHYHFCEDESLIGASLHGLYFGRKI